MPSRSVAVRLDEELVDELERAAKAKNVSLSEEVRDRLLASFQKRRGSADIDDLASQVRATHLALARGFEGVFRALASPGDFELEEALEFVRTRIREGL